MPPLITVGSRPPASSSVATIEVVVVLPWVPAMATQLFSRISSASISARRTTGRRCARAATSSGLSRLIAVETTTHVGAVDVLGLVADHDLDALLAQPLDVGVVGGVRALHGVAEIAQHLGDAAHADAADADEVDGSDFARQSHGRFLMYLRHARACPGHPRMIQRQFLQDVDGRDKPGHDEDGKFERYLTVNSRDFRHQVGQPFGGVEPAGAARAAAISASRCGSAAKRGDLRREPIRRELVLRNADRAAGLHQHAGIGELVLVDRARQRHQDRGPADAASSATVPAPERETTRWLAASRAGRSVKNGASSALILSRS